MAHFAKLNDENLVEQVVVVHNSDAPTEAAGIVFLVSLFGPGPWKQTSYNGNIRKNFAGTGFLYDAGRDAFIAPQPYASWSLDEDTCRWEPPHPMPVDGGVYVWDEESLAWVSP